MTIFSVQCCVIYIISRYKIIKYLLIILELKKKSSRFFFFLACMMCIYLTLFFVSLHKIQKKIIHSTQYCLQNVLNHDMDDTSVRKQLTKFFNQAIHVPKYVSYFFFISYLFTCVTEYSCIDFKYYNTLFWLSFHCFHSDHIINLLKRSTKFLYDAKYSTNIMALTHTRMIIEIRIGASISSLVERMDS